MPAATFTLVGSIFRRGHYILRDVNVTANESDRIGLIGANGTGKTTVLRTIAGILDPRPTLSVRWPQGRLKTAASLNPDAPAPTSFRVDRTLDGLATQYRQPRRDWRLVAEALALQDELTRVRVRKLSTGNRQRLSLAIALTPRADILLADEPTVGLDDAGTAALVDLLNARSYATMVLASHDLDFLSRTCNRVWILDGSGQIVDEHAMRDPAPSTDSTDLFVARRSSREQAVRLQAELPNMHVRLVESTCFVYNGSSEATTIMHALPPTTIKLDKPNSVEAAFFRSGVQDRQ